MSTDTSEKVKSRAGNLHQTVTIPLRVNVGESSRKAAALVVVGVPCQPGAVRQPMLAWFKTTDGNESPAQVQTLMHWPDGSSKWLLAEFLLASAGTIGDHCSLIVTSGSPTNGHTTQLPNLSLRKDADKWTVRTGAQQFTIAQDSLAPFSVTLNNVATASTTYTSSLVFEDAAGVSHVPVVNKWQVERDGNISMTLVGQGTIPSIRGLLLRVRQTFFANTGLVKLDITLHNTRRAKHPGGLWDLGDAGSILFKDLSLLVKLPTNAGRTLAVSDGTGAEPQLAKHPSVSLYQDSSGGTNWNSRNHVNRNGEVACKFRGYRMTLGGHASEGERISPTIGVADDIASIAAAVPKFWQQFPKAIILEGFHLRFGLFPREASDLFELQGGERKTHELWLDFNGDGRDAVAACRALDWVHDPVRIWPERSWCDECGVLPELDVPTRPSLTKLEKLLDEGRDGPRGLYANREAVDEYGWRNFGDVLADHEQLNYKGELPLISHYNNQFDLLHGFLLHALRNAVCSWWDLADALARHVVEIDIYNTSEDKASYNGGLFWFTDHYLHAQTSTHRTYTKHNCGANKSAYGGGPGAEHNFTSGLLLHYCLTGNRDSRDAVLTLADWVIAMDDGARNVLGVLDDNPTGLASTAYARGLGRAAGNSINALLDAWQLTSREKYLGYAEILIHRCIHPNDDIVNLDLLKVEKNWSYTVFLSAIAKYLRLKASAEEFDSNYDYARQSLTRYGEWMLNHERPYFDQIGDLEFPTEAWAAQEFRKANVLRLAAQYVDEPLRTRMFDRGDVLADRAWDDLLRFETRTTARSLAIMLNEGLTECALRSRPAICKPQATIERDFGRPEEFVSQRDRIRQDATSVRGAVRLVARLLNPLRWQRYRETITQSRSAADRD